MQRCSTAIPYRIVTMIGLMFAHPAMKTKAAGEMRERWRHAVRVSVPVTLFVLAMLTGGDVSEGRCFICSGSSVSLMNHWSFRDDRFSHDPIVEWHHGWFFGDIKSIWTGNIDLVISGYIYPRPLDYKIEHIFCRVTSLRYRIHLLDIIAWSCHGKRD